MIVSATSPPALGIARLLSLATTFSVAAGTGCNVEELDVGYLAIPEITVAPADQSPRDGVVALRLVRGSTSLGFYPVPADVPLLNTGATAVTLEPTVRRSGDSQELRVYPMYQPVEVEIQLLPGRTDTVRPVFGYREEVTVGLEETFESPANALTLDLQNGNSPAIAQSTDTVAGGLSSGRITLTAASPVFEVATDVVVPDRDRVLDLWLELDYRGDAVLALTLFPEAVPPLQQGQPIASRYFQGALPREDWTRIYFDIVDVSNRDFLTDGFRVSLLAVFDPERGASQEVFVDNLRVVYR